MLIIRTAAELAEVAPARKGKKQGRRAVVMTMGALHEGHAALVRAARKAADQVVVTVFVNPLQFGDPTDLERYPRDLDADAALLEPLGVDVIYAPSVDDVYPGGDPIVTVSAGAINDVFEGVYRPGHFDGVLTVVLKLLQLTQPDVAFFGQKDAQQVIAIRTMCRDLNVPVEIAVVPTVRDEDGLALSSRNARLTDAERADALVLSRALSEAEQVLDEGGPLSLALTVARAAFAEVPSVMPDYIGAMDPASAQPVAGDYRGDVVIAVAAQVGGTRLIDNVMTRVGPREGAADA
jgi:pantoate--beta-alanine ligase